MSERLRRVISDYYLAVKTSTRGRWLSAPSQMLRVAASRLIYHLGPRLYCLYRLDRKPVRTWRSYVDDANKAPQRTINPAASRRLVDDKVAFHRECLKHDLKTVQVLGLFPEDSTALFSDSPPPMRDPAHLQQLLDAHPDGLFVKPRGGAHGEGAFPILPESGGWRFPGGVGTSRDVFDYCVSCAQRHTLLVQPRLITTEALRCVMAPTGFGTIRAVTYMHDQVPALVAACLRIVVEGNAADNFTHGTSGNLVASIDTVTGTLITARASRSRAWPDIVDLDTHPVTGVRLVGLQIPYWSELLKLVLRAQVAFGGLCTVGWDVGITQDGPLLVEANALYDLDLLQVAYDRGFAPDLQQIVRSARHSSSPSSRLSSIRGASTDSDEQMNVERPSTGTD
jgi:hypothetical protein